MAIVVKDAASVVKKWQTNASAAGQFYQAGIQNPRRDQTQTAIAAQQTWATAVQQAAAAGSFAKGLQRTQGKWQARSLAVGVQRYPQGITSGVSSYTSGITAVLQVISSITLSQPRMPRGDPANFQRSQQVGTALHAAKLAGQL